MIRCSSCGKRFVDIGQFAKHMIDMHMGEAETMLNFLYDIKGIDIDVFVTQLKACYDTWLHEHHWKE